MAKKLKPKKIEVFSTLGNGKKPRWLTAVTVVETLGLRRVMMHAEQGILCIRSATHTLAYERPLWRRSKK